MNLAEEDATVKSDKSMASIHFVDIELCHLLQNSFMVWRNSSAREISTSDDDRLFIEESM